MPIKDTSMPVFKIKLPTEMTSLEIQLSNMKTIKQDFENYFDYDENITFKLDASLFHLDVYYCDIYMIGMDIKEEVEKYNLSKVLHGIDKVEYYIEQLKAALFNDDVNEVFSYIEKMTLEEQNKLLKAREEYRKGGHHNYEGSKE